MENLKGKILYTKDGRKLGNSLCINNYENDFFKIITDYGNIVNHLSLTEINDYFYIGNKCNDDHKHFNLIEP